MATTNNSLNNKSATSIAGSTEKLTISNSDNTTTSGAQLQIVTGGTTTTGDPQTTYKTGAVSSFTWSTGIDVDSSSNFVIANSGVLGTSNNYVIDQAHLTNNFPNHPAFLCVLTATTAGVTGDSTVYNFNPTANLLFNRGNFTFNTSVVSIATTGIYFFFGGTQLTNCLANTSLKIQIGLLASNQLSKTINRPAAATDIGIGLSGILSLNAGDSVRFRITGNGEVSARDKVVGGTTPVTTYFGGYLMC